MIACVCCTVDQYSTSTLYLVSILARSVLSGTHCALAKKLVSILILPSSVYVFSIPKYKVILGIGVLCFKAKDGAMDCVNAHCHACTLHKKRNYSSMCVYQVED